jgi:hypothetical protein
MKVEGGGVTGADAPAPLVHTQEPGLTQAEGHLQGWQQQGGLLRLITSHDPGNCECTRAHDDS